jgi:hypothetical protein
MSNIRSLAVISVIIIGGCSDAPTMTAGTNDDPGQPFGGLVDAGDNLIAPAGTTVELNGSASGFGEAELAYAWRQISGPSVTFSGPSSRPTVHFVAPPSSGDSVMEFELAVTGNNVTETDTVTVTVFGVLNGASAAVVAQAGSNQEVLEATLVQLSAAGSGGMNSSLPLELQWTQVSGPDIMLSSNIDAVVTFIAPAVTGKPAQLAFQLTVTQGGQIASDIVEITVLPGFADAPCDTELQPHSTVVFDVTPGGGAGPLGVTLSASSIDGAALPSGPDVVYTWYFGDNGESVSSDQANRSHVFSTPGIYTVSLCITIGATTWACMDAQQGHLERQINVWPGISGRILDDGSPVDGVVVSANNVPGGASALTNTDGRFTLNVPFGWSGVISPSHIDFDFNPPFVALTGVVTDLTNIDFVAMGAGTTAAAAQCSDDADCNDGSYCSGIETCVSGMCQSGDSPCPGLLCNETTTSCFAVECAGDNECDDSLFCNGQETCSDGFCTSGSKECPGQSCDETANACSDCLSSADCGDGLFCNGAESCVAGSCTAGSNPCNSGETCDEAADACETISDCAVDGDCSDGQYCNGDERCLDGSCVAGATPCTGQLCNEITNACVNCLAQSDCDDGQFCNGPETCSAGTCSNGSSPCNQDETCDEATDTCSPAQQTCSSDSDCDDGQFCNGVETCSSPVCSAGSVPCSASELCDEATDSCFEAPANVYYVDDNGAQQPGYNPSAAAGSISNPFTTIQAAANTVQPGDTVLIRQGVYTRSDGGAWKGVVEISTAGTEALPITFKNYANEEVIVDAQNGLQFYAIRLGNPIIASAARAQHLIIEGLKATNGERNGIFVYLPNNVVIRDCEVYGNNQAYETKGFTASSQAGIHVVAGERCTIERCRVYDNGYGVIFYEENPSASTPVGTKDCIIRDNFFYSNANSGQFGNAGGIDVRFTDGCLVEGNVMWDNPDGHLLGLGPINNRFIANACLHSWQPGGNNEGIKVSVRGGGANLFAFNISVLNSQRGVDIGDGIGEILLNNTTYHNKEWGYLLEGRQTIILNSVGYDDFYPHTEVGNREIALSSIGSFEAMHPTSDYNFAADETGLPNMQYGHVQHNTLAGNPLFVDPVWAMDESDPRAVLHPEQVFPDPNNDGEVTPEEALQHVASRYALAPTSSARDAGTTLADAESRIQAARLDVIAMTQERINDWAGNGVLQHQQAVAMWTQMIANLQAPDHALFGDLDGMRDLSGNAIPMHQALHMGAVQNP